MVEEKFLQIDKSKIRYLESGSSENTLILLHGLGASAERWGSVIPRFERTCRVIVPDLIGFGYSDKPAVDYTPEFFGDFLAKFVAALDISHPSLIGSSLGGQIAVEYASAHPKKVQSIILVSPAGFMKQSTPALDAYIMAAMYPNEQNAKNAFEMMDGAGRDIDERIISGFIARMRLPNAKLAFMSALLGLKNSESIAPKLKSISSPALLVWGSEDPVIPIIHADEFIASIKNCRFCRMDGLGHTPYVQDPPAFAAKVLEFLNGI